MIEGMNSNATLLEGENAITVTATDGAGLTTTAATSTATAHSPPRSRSGWLSAANMWTLLT